MKQQVLLISYVDREVAELRNLLKNCKSQPNVDFAVNMRQGFQRLAQTPANLIVMNFDSVNDVVYKHVRNLKSVVERCPLLVLGKVDDIAIMNQIAQIGQTVILDKPFEPKDLGGLTAKILESRTVHQRVHRRFTTHQNAFIEVYGKNVESDTRLINLSRGGAFLEVSSTSKVEIGDLVRMNVDLNETKRNYRMHAKVVWMTPTADQSIGLGVEFVRPKDVFREMQGR